MSNLQINKLKSGIKDGSEITSNLLSNVIGGSNDGTNFPHKLLLINTQNSKLFKDFPSGSSANLKFSKTQLHKIGLLGRRLRRRLIKTGVPLMKSILKSLAKSVSIPLGLTAAVSATDASIQKQSFAPALTILIISHEGMDVIMKIGVDFYACY